MEMTSTIVRKVIEDNQIYVHFQPIVSVNMRRTVGAEALSRGSYGQEIISPYYLFEYAKDLGLTATLDRLCRNKALETFSKHPFSSMLFLNFEADVLSMPDGEAEILLKKSLNIPHEQIVIEINEKYVSDHQKLLRFVEFYRSKGFMIALDDVGAGHSNLNRISIVHPDIVKIDMALVKGIDKSPYSQEVFKSIVNLSKKIGACTIAEGAETVDEVVTCMLCGADFFQGYYFSKPLPPQDFCKLELEEKMTLVAQSMNETVKQRQQLEHACKTNYVHIINHLIDQLQTICPDEYESVMLRFVTENAEVECVFLLDIYGVQISDTIILPESLGDPHFAFFAPAVKGDRHNIKNYYYAVKEGLEDPFISDWYISNATGKSCKTISSKFLDKEGNPIIVCVDMKYEQNR